MVLLIALLVLQVLGLCAKQEIEMIKNDSNLLSSEGLAPTGVI